MSPVTQAYAGTITRVFADGSCAVVKLESPVFGKQHAVIGSRTKGRIAKMNGVGRLVPETPVKGEAVDGPDAAIAVTVD